MGETVNIQILMKHKFLSSSIKNKGLHNCTVQPTKVHKTDCRNNSECHLNYLRTTKASGVMQG